MRVFQLVSSTGFFGAENVLLELAVNLRQQAIQVAIGVLGNQRSASADVVRRFEDRRFDVLNMPCRGRIDIRTIQFLRSWLFDKDIDILHTHGYKSNIYALLAAGGGIPLVTTCHNWIGTGYKMRLYAYLDKMFLRRFEKVVAVSDQVKAQVLRAGVDENRVALIDNGIDTDRFKRSESDRVRIRRELGIHDTDVAIGTVGRISEEKGHEVLLRAARTLHERNSRAVFLVIGDGPLRENLQGRFAEKWIHFLGFRSDMPAVYSGLDIFVLPSFDEGLPMVLLESMAAGLPAVATRVGAIPRVIVEGETGILVDPGDETGLIQALELLLTHPAEARRFAGAGLARAGSFSSGRMAGAYLELYRTLV